MTLPGNVLPAAGLYPDQAPKFDRAMAEKFFSLLVDLKPRAIGEVGVDLHWHYATLKEQEVLFRNQIELSITMNLPLIVHSRDAFEDTDRILGEYKFKQAVIIHCFGYGPSEAQEFLAKGYFVSFAGNLTYPKAIPLQEALKLVPLDKLLMETDCPYLSPQPVRGDKNNPLNVKYTYEHASALKGLETKVLAEQVEKNFRKVFGV
jgi:TatD DNase family protein